MLNKEEKIEEILNRSISTVYPNKESLKETLLSGKILRIYMGIDPTASYVHIGHATNYLILKRLHNLGHKIIILIGDFTAMIGDPSDKTALRKKLSKEEVLENLKTFKKQIGKIINFEDKNNPIEFKFNSEWLSELSWKEGIELASYFTVQQMIERDNFQKRIKENKPLYLHEFLYPLMQGYDSVMIKAGAELGGTDQRFNLLAGRKLQEYYGQEPQDIVITSLMEGADGRKMSSSWGNTVNLKDEPNDMFGKIMSIPDNLIMKYFILATRVDSTDLIGVQSQFDAGANPRDIKARLAREIVKMYHGEKLALSAQATFDKQFRDKEMPDEIEGKKVEIKSWRPDDLLVELGLVASKTEARRMIAQGGVKIDGQKVANLEEIMVKSGMVISVGKRKFVRIK
ncbi:MAG: tyrosine--tRNA ligase [bacterium]|nr:tyrosine--tRNA ligase [bacterium]